jgi:hypothetical protein
MWQMQWNLRGILVALVVVIGAAACLTFASIRALRDREGTRAWSAKHSIRALPRPVSLDDRGTTYTLEFSSDAVELFPASTGDLHFDLAGLRSRQRETPHWEPPGEAPRPPRAPVACWGFDWEAWLWEYKFPRGDLILNPEVLDSIRPPE